MTPPARILIVEDERLVALALARRLRQLGYIIAGLATSGTEAIMQALAHDPDLVLMDLRLPGAVDGLEAAQFLRTHLNLPLLVITGVTDVTTLARARQISPMQTSPRFPRHRWGVKRILPAHHLLSNSPSLVPQ